MGTTKFDDLVRTVDSAEIVALLQKQGYNEMVMQIGCGDYEPSYEPPTGFACSHFRKKATLADDIAAADLVISHGGESPKDTYSVEESHPCFVSPLPCHCATVCVCAGAGTIMEVLRAKKMLVAVVNESLMGNHQAELTGALGKPNSTTSILCAPLNSTRLLHTTAHCRSLVPPPAAPHAAEKRNYLVSTFPRDLHKALAKLIDTSAPFVFEEYGQADTSLLPALADDCMGFANID